VGKIKKEKIRANSIVKVEQKFIVAARTPEPGQCRYQCVPVW
jgi:hypothetical protein